MEDASTFHTPHFHLTTADGAQLQCHLHHSAPNAPNYEILWPFFLHATADTVKRTFEATTQYAWSISSGNFMKKTYCSPFPGLNVHQCCEAVATDKVYSDVPAIDDGSMAAQIFVGRQSLVTDVYGVKTDKQFVNTLEDNICCCGARLNDPVYLCLCRLRDISLKMCCRYRRLS